MADQHRFTARVGGIKMGRDRGGISGSPGANEKETVRLAEAPMQKKDLGDGRA